MNESFTYFEDDDIVVTLQNLEGHIFVHLGLDKLTPSRLKKLREGFDLLLNILYEKDVDIVHAAGDNPKSIKLWQMVKPCWRLDEVKENPGTFVGCWITEKE